jgi:hypothetical protein
LTKEVYSYIITTYKKSNKEIKMKLKKYSVSSHTFGVFKKESQLNSDSLREYNIINNRLHHNNMDILRRINNLYVLNSYDAETTLKKLIEELKEITD